MTDPQNAELIVRLEKATGPDRELDFLLFEAVAFPQNYFGSKIESWSRAGGAGYTVNTADGMRHLSAFNAPRYTGSLDTALPGEDIVQVRAPFCGYSWNASARTADRQSCVVGFGSTEPLARRAAALRARAVHS